MFIRSVERDTTLDTFRAEVRTFCEKELPAEARSRHSASTSSATSMTPG